MSKRRKKWKKTFSFNNRHVENFHDISIILVRTIATLIKKKNKKQFDFQI